MNNHDDMIKRLIELKEACRDISYEHWLRYELFTWVWWLNLIFLIAPLIIWWRLVDRKRILEITVFGLIISTQAVFLDVIGSALVLWEYPIRFLPHALLIIPTDIIFIPVVFMFVYQYCIQWKHFWAGIAVVAAVLSFIFEPLAVLIGGYILLGWKYIYSFPVYILAAIAGRLITDKIAQQRIE